MSSSELSSSELSSSERLQNSLSLLKPFNELYYSTQKSIEATKLNFPDPSGKLLHHLAVLGVAQLSDYLAWIPFERFTTVELLGRGGFATVWKGAVELGSDIKWYALKEVSQGQMAEVSSFLSLFPHFLISFACFLFLHFNCFTFDQLVLHVVIACNGAAFSSPVPRIYGVTYSSSGQYLMVMELAKEGTLENTRDATS